MKQLRNAGVVLLVCAGCATTSRTQAFREIESLLDDQVAAWNRGDVEGFMNGYARSPDLSFSAGGKVTRSL